MSNDTESGFTPVTTDGAGELRSTADISDSSFTGDLLKLNSNGDGAVDILAADEAMEPTVNKEVINIYTSHTDDDGVRISSEGSVDPRGIFTDETCVAPADVEESNARLKKKGDEILAAVAKLEAEGVDPTMARILSIQ